MIRVGEHRRGEREPRTLITIRKKDSRDVYPRLSRQFRVVQHFAKVIPPVVVFADVRLLHWRGRQQLPFAIQDVPRLNTIVFFFVGGFIFI